MSNPRRSGATLARPIPRQCAGSPYAADDWARLRRFLVLGTDGPSHHAPRGPLTRDAAAAVERCIHTDGTRAVAEIVRISDAGRAPTNDPALYALAMAAGLGDDATRRAALDALPRVVTTGAHLLRFAAFVEEFRGWGRALRRAIARWYAAHPVDALAREALTNHRPDGVEHRDLLRLAHPGRSVSAGNPTVGVTPEHERLFGWIVRGGTCHGLPRVVEGFARARSAPTAADAARLVAEYRLPHAAVRDEHLATPAVWAALLPDLPLTTLTKHLATMGRLGVFAPGSEHTGVVTARLLDAHAVRRAGLRPVELLAALRAYAAGRAGRGRHRWEPVPEVVAALDTAFHAALRHVARAGRRLLLALDVSESMDWGEVPGVPGLTPRDAAAAVALATAATEPRHEIVGFHAGGWFRDRGRHRHDGIPDGLTRLPIAPGDRIGDVLRTTSGLPFGTTDCALPMLYAQALEREVDTFVILTDSETWTGDVDPVQALRDYRRASGIDARLVVVGMASNGFSIADPADAGMLDVVGFDAATPQVVAEFARRAL